MHLAEGKAKYRQRMAKAGPSIMEQVERNIRRYVVMPSEHAYVAAVLWTAATHAIAVWDHAPRLCLVSPERRCGKTRAAEVCAEMSFNPMETVQITIAALYRTVNKTPCTIFHDEADGVFGGGNADEATKELRTFYNGGFNRNKPVYRCVNGGAEVKPFKTFAMAAFTSIKDLPDTIMDRSIVLRMRRRAANEKVDSLRARDLPALRAVGKELGAWVSAMIDELSAADPSTPLDDRAADVWAPLLAIADAAGGDWPDRAREAAKAVTEYEETMSHEPMGQKLLADIRRLWPLLGETIKTDSKPDRVRSAALVERLNDDIEESGWSKFGRGMGLDPTSLAELLRPYEIRPKTVKFAGQDGKGRKGAKGYYLADFERAWKRYLAEE